MSTQTVYQALGIDAADPPHRDLVATWVICFGALVLAFPVYSYLVFGMGMDRGAIANVLATQVTVCYWLGICAAFLPLRGLRGWSRLRRIHAVCLAFMFVSYLTHLSWELGWLLLHGSIAQARDELWAYAWWAYIDGGDLRYYQPQVNFIMMEVLSVINGSIGLTGLWLLFRSGFEDYRGSLLCLSTGVTHTVLAWYYYGSEILSGFAHVNTHSFFDLWVKFIFLNGPWLVFPWLVIYWAIRLLRVQLAR
jgi:hypothetical protein